MELAKAKTASVALANEKIEQIHNMPYDSLATEHGFIYPPGTILMTKSLYGAESVSMSTRDFYIDDPFDGNATGTIIGKPQDLYPYDYKKVEVTVSKVGRNGYLSKLTTNVAAKAAETPSNTGIIKLCVIDSTGSPVSGATLTIENSELDPPVEKMSGVTGIDGCIMVPSLPPDSQNNYHLTATKDGFSTDLTYPRTAQNPNELYQDIDIIIQQVTEKTLIIDRLSTMEITFVDSSGKVLPNTSFHVRDSKEIYFNPSTYKYSQDLTTDANGHISLTDMGFGDYVISVPSGAIAAVSPYQPIDLKESYVRLQLPRSHTAIDISATPASE